MPNPRFPLYIVSKGRADSRYTARSLEEQRVPYNIVVEESEVEEYRAACNPEFCRVLMLPDHYKDDYDCFDDLGRTKSTGPGPARNFVWDHSVSEGHAWHWVMDDNIRRFFRLNKNDKIAWGDGTPWYVMEEFCLRYRNISMAGPNYAMFAPRKTKVPPFICNTRIYSCNFIRNDTPYRWRGRYNEDTDISLRMLKDGWVTVQFNAFLQNKINTQKVKGGNSAEFYDKEGTLPKSEMQVKMHPDVSRVSWRFGRWHHHVDYGPFRKNKLVLRDDAEVTDGVNDFGMRVVPRMDAAKDPFKAK